MGLLRNSINNLSVCVPSQSCQHTATASINNNNRLRVEKRKSVAHHRQQNLYSTNEKKIGKKETRTNATRTRHPIKSPALAPNHHRIRPQHTDATSAHTHTHAHTGRQCASVGLMRACTPRLLYDVRAPRFFCWHFILPRLSAIYL